MHHVVDVEFSLPPLLEQGGFAVFSLIVRYPVCAAHAPYTYPNSNVVFAYDMSLHTSSRTFRTQALHGVVLATVETTNAPSCYLLLTIQKLLVVPASSPEEVLLLLQSLEHALPLVFLIPHSRDGLYVFHQLLYLLGRLPKIVGAVSLS